MNDIIFEPLEFRNLSVKNRIFRSNIAGRLDNYDGSGNQARINWELKFARGGVGTIISSFVPVSEFQRLKNNVVPLDLLFRILDLFSPSSLPWVAIWKLIKDPKEKVEMNDIIFEPLEFRNLSVKNRIFRSNIAGRLDNYDGSGNQARINWELKFARGGVGTIISSFVPVSIRGRIVPNFATVHRDEYVPFWRKLGERVHEFDCKYIMQLSHSGRQRDIPGIEFPKGISSTGDSEPLHGFQCEQMTLKDINDVVQEFAQAARRARQAGLDGVELHGANGYLITQFLSKGINNRKDDYGGSLENRARFVLDIVKAIRSEVGDDFHLQMKISGTDYNRALLPWERKGNTIEDSIQVCKWLEAAGVNAIHASTGSLFPHPRNPAGGMNMKALAQNYDIMGSSGSKTLRNLLIFI